MSILKFYKTMNTYTEEELVRWEEFVLGDWRFIFWKLLFQQKQDKNLIIIFIKISMTFLKKTRKYDTKICMEKIRDHNRHS